SRLAKQAGVVFEEASNTFSGETAISLGSARGGAFAHCCFAHFSCSIKHGVHAIGQAFDRALAFRAPVGFKRSINALLYGADGYARFLPGFQDRPVERRDQQMRSALLPKIFLDFGEV